jgi:hypothetical protein
MGANITQCSTRNTRHIRAQSSGKIANGHSAAVLGRDEHRTRTRTVLQRHRPPEQRSRLRKAQRRDVSGQASAKRCSNSAPDRSRDQGLRCMSPAEATQHRSSHQHLQAQAKGQQGVQTHVSVCKTQNRPQSKAKALTGLKQQRELVKKVQCTRSLGP